MRLLLAFCLLAAAPARGSDLDTLTSWMTGSFSSEDQAKAVESFHDIRLEMVPIWKHRDDGPWLYVEQAAAESLDEPYRQRVYRLSVDDDGAFRSEVYTLPDPLSWAGSWRDEEPLAELEPHHLQRRRGCAVVLSFNNETFLGSTIGTGCSSSLRGASYATSEVGVSANAIMSWDRGFDREGQQVWGAEIGPYVFRRED